MHGEEIDRLFAIADHRLDTKTEATEIGQSENTINVPKCIIIDITKQVGCKYVYLFAADKTEDLKESEMKKLISHYKNNFKFSECDEGIKFVKPEYDNHCYGLIQSVSMLESNREAIWHEFSDV